MARLNLTLDPDTFAKLGQHARREGGQLASVARAILREGLAKRDEQARRRKLAADYAGGRADVRAALKDFEAAQDELLEHEEA